MPMNLLYNTGIHTYAAAVRAAAATGVSAKARAMVRGQRQSLERIARWKENHPGGFDLWVHAASLGEFEQGRPLIERVLAENPEANILLSFFSPSGYTVRENFHPRVLTVYLPLDTPGAARRFVQAASPRAAVFVKYEFWGNILQTLRRLGTPVYLISAVFRPSQAFFRKGGATFRTILRQYSHIFVQDQASAALLAGIGHSNVTVAGDTRFDRVAAIGSAPPDIAPLEALRRRAPFLLVAGSTWPPDEEGIAKYLTENPQTAAIIAPHEFNDQRLAALGQQLGKDHTVRLSKINGSIPEGTRYVLVDSFGLLSKLYAYADVAYIGGGFGAGIHNINEAAAWGVPVVFGPNNSKFLEAQDLKRLGGAFQIATPGECPETLRRLQTDDTLRRKAAATALEYIKSNIGATDKIWQHIKSDLKG